MSTEGVPEYEIALENGWVYSPTVPTSFEMFENLLMSKIRSEDAYPFITIWQGKNATCIHIDSIASFTRLVEPEPN